MKMYSALAKLWPLISPPRQYQEESQAIARIIKNKSHSPKSLLELGSGGGNTASHLKADFSMTLVDIAPKMLEVSRQLNPECTHIQGDMRTIKLGQTFDSVFIHDAIMYMADRESLIQALGTARLHCHPEGHILVIPSAFKSNFTTATFNGAHDTPTTSIRYMEWRHDPDPKDCTFDVDFSFMILEKGKPMEVVYDHHIFGLFTKEEWLEAGQEVGLDCDIISLGYGKLPSSYGQVLLYRHKPE